MKQATKQQFKPILNQGILNYIVNKPYSISDDEHDEQLKNLRLTDLSSTDRCLYELCEKMESYRYQGRSIYLLTITFKLKKGKSHHPATIERLATNFYIKYFLKKIMSRNFATSDKLYSRQPRVYGFMDDHAPTSSNDFADRLHYHFVLAVDPEDKPAIDNFLGKNLHDKKHKDCKPIKEMHLKESSGEAITAYAAKEYEKYEEYTLIFGPNLH